MGFTADGLMQTVPADCQQPSSCICVLASLMFVDRLLFLPGSGPVCDLTLSLLQLPQPCHPRWIILRRAAAAFDLFL